jgi:hypothetical protein
MFQAFIDDSKTDRKLFVLAGYIAPAETWALFSDDWDAELKSEPPLEEFKMSQMLIEPARCERFYRIIEKHVTSAISVRIDLAAHARVVASLEWPPGLNNQAEVTGPYWFAYNMIIDYLYRHHSGLRLTDRVDFIFDDQSEKKHVRDTWDYFKSTGSPELQRIMGDKPVFKCSHALKPLQAADLWAWWVRRWFVNGIEDGVVRLDFPWTTRRDLRRLEILADEEGLRKSYGELVRQAWTLFGAKNLHLNRYCCSWPPWRGPWI